MDRATIVICFAVIAVMLVMTRNRNETWRDPLTLWQDAAAKSPEKTRTLNNVALEYRKRGDTEQAIRYFSDAANAPHGFASERDIARANLAWMHFTAGQTQIAIGILNGILKESTNLDVMNMLALVALADGSPEEAIRIVDDIVRINHNFRGNSQLHLTRGQALQALGLCEEAMIEYLFVQTLLPGASVPTCIPVH